MQHKGKADCGLGLGSYVGSEMVDIINFGPTMVKAHLAGIEDPDGGSKRRNDELIRNSNDVVQMIYDDGEKANDEHDEGDLDVDVDGIMLVVREQNIVVDKVDNGATNNGGHIDDGTNDSESYDDDYLSSDEGNYEFSDKEKDE